MFINISNLLITVYVFIIIALAVYGFNTLVMSLLFLWYRRKDDQEFRSCTPERWPTVTVQLPLFNERFVVERLIDAVVALDYPGDRLKIQVLDDSVDETTALARARVAYHQSRGSNIELIRRPNRNGYKAGALTNGLCTDTSEFVAIFDADFAPSADFLRQVIPYFANEKIGMVQTRWGHLNAELDPFTRAQALALDGHFVVEQTARSRSGLMMNFNGSGGIWRRDCIEDAGGWDCETIAEDLDLSYRAQLAGWKLHYLPNVVALAEIPVLLTGFKRQQFRWAKGAIQCLSKFGGTLLTSRMPIWKKIQAYLHLSGYMVHPFMLAMILIGLPVILLVDSAAIPLGALGVAGFAPPILFALAQWGAYPNWVQRFLYFPFLALLGAGVALNNTWAVLEGITGRNPKEFLRTPKFQAEGRRTGRLKKGVDYNLPVDWTTWGELIIALYCLIELSVALTRAPGLVPFLAMYTVGYSYTACLGLWQSKIRFPSVDRKRKPLLMEKVDL